MRRALAPSLSLQLCGIELPPTGLASSLPMVDEACVVWEGKDYLIPSLP